MLKLVKCREVIHGACFQGTSSAGKNYSNGSQVDNKFISSFYETIDLGLDTTTKINEILLH